MTGRPAGDKLSAVYAAGCSNRTLSIAACAHMTCLVSYGNGVPVFPPPFFLIPQTLAVREEDTPTHSPVQVVASV